MAENDGSRDRVKEKIEEICEEVRALRPGGDLDGLMETRKIGKLGQALVNR